MWNHSKLVNDVLKSLEACGSFVIVDEELSTVHFAHSSVKQHLLSEPTNPDVEHDVHHYHIGSSQADKNLGKLIVTFLNLLALSSQEQVSLRNLIRLMFQPLLPDRLLRNMTWSIKLL